MNNLFAIQLRKLWFCETPQIKPLLQDIPYLNVLIQLPYKKDNSNHHNKANNYLKEKNTAGLWKYGLNFSGLQS